MRGLLAILLLAVSAWANLPEQPQDLTTSENEDYLLQEVRQVQSDRLLTTGGTLTGSLSGTDITASTLTVTTALYVGFSSASTTVASGLSVTSTCTTGAYAIGGACFYENSTCSAMGGGMTASDKFTCSCGGNMRIRADVFCARIKP